MAPKKRMDIIRERPALIDLAADIEVLRRSVRNYFHGRIRRDDFLSCWIAAAAKVNQTFEAYREKFGN